MKTIFPKYFSCIFSDIFYNKNIVIEFCVISNTQTK
jgi:hypothetical protein